MPTQSNPASKWVWAAVVLGFCGVFIAKQFYIACALCVAMAIVSAMLPQLHVRSAKKRWLARAHDNPIVLHPPFQGTWKVDSGGPDQAHNRHHADIDQRFAYDFVPETSSAWDRAVLAPCDGLVAHVEDRNEDASVGERQRDKKAPLGNYIAIEIDRGFVLIGHLKQGSIAVHAGATVRIGEQIAKAGNSGTSSGSHIHVHAQDSAFSDPGIANALPIAFIDQAQATPLLLEYGDLLSESPRVP